MVLTYNFGNMEADNVEHLGHHGAVHEGVQGVDVQRGDVVHLEVKSIEEGKLQKKMQRSSLLFGGQNLFGSFKHFVETRMVGNELTIFSNIIGAFTISVWRIITQAYGDLLGSPHYPPQVAAL